MLNDMERQDGTSVVTGISTNSGVSNVQQSHGKLQVQAELCRRRPSLESGRRLQAFAYSFEHDAITAIFAISKMSCFSNVYVIK